jgi:hypothetical protein
MNKTVYIRLDVDNAGDSIELALLKADYNEAQNIHNLIQKNINFILEKIENRNTTTILMKGCDDILISTNENDYNLTFWKELKSEFKLKSGFTLSIGIGYSITECMLNLRIAKVSGKDKIVDNNNS